MYFGVWFIRGVASLELHQLIFAKLKLYAALGCYGFYVFTRRVYTLIEKGQSLLSELLVQIFFNQKPQGPVPSE